MHSVRVSFQLLVSVLFIAIPGLTVTFRLDILMCARVVAIVMWLRYCVSHI